MLWNIHINKFLSMRVVIYSLKEFVPSVIIILLGKELSELIDNKKRYMVEYR